MNDLLNMTILAVVQGLTEFLPVSSSGHLVLAKTILGFEELSGLGVEVLLHGGTVVAVLLYYWRFIVETVRGLFRRDREAWRFAVAVVVSMIPAVVLGLLFEDELEAAAGSPLFVCGALVFTGVLLLATRLFGRDGLGRDVSVCRGLLMGVAQAIAMLPGVSRSGSTIAMSRFLGVASDKAAAFSFLMVVPVIVGGNLLYLIRALTGGDSPFADLTWGMGLTGFCVSAAVGYASVAWMVRLLGRHHFWLFGFYCVAVGLVGGAWLILA